MDNSCCFIGRVNSMQYSTRNGTNILNFTLKVKRGRFSDDYDIVNFSAYFELADEFKEVLNIGDSIRVIGPYRAPVQEKDNKVISGCFAHFLVQQIIPIKTEKNK